MFGLPAKTEVHKQLPKKLIYETFGMSSAERDKFDRDIGKILIAHELSPTTLQVQKGKEVHACFVLLVELKTKDYSEQRIIALTKLIPQNMIFALKHGSDIQFAVIKSRFLHTPWMHEDEALLAVEGLSMDTIWQNLVIKIGSIELNAQNTLDEQIVLNERNAQRLKHIEQLEKLARKETQPRKKLEFFEKIQALKLDGDR